MPVTDVLFVLGTRPEAIKGAPVIHALNLEPESFKTRVLATERPPPGSWPRSRESRLNHGRVNYINQGALTSGTFNF